MVNGRFIIIFYIINSSNVLYNEKIIYDNLNKYDFNFKRLIDVKMRATSVNVLNKISYSDNLIFLRARTSMDHYPRPGTPGPQGRLCILAPRLTCGRPVQSWCRHLETHPRDETVDQFNCMRVVVP